MPKNRLTLIGIASTIVLAISAWSGGGGGAESVPQLTIPIATELRPTPDGFSFPNFPASATPIGFGDADLFAMFGAEACVDGVSTPCVATAEAAAWARMVNQARVSGHCEGLVVQAAHDHAVAAGSEFYTDPETGLMVMTVVCLIRRGYCCNNTCRHCPFDVS